MRTLLQNGHGSMLTFGLEVEFFAAMKVPTLSRFPVGHIIGLVGDRLSFIRLHGPDGHGARVMVEGDNEEPDGQLDYSCWNITTSMTVAANHPDWFLSC